MSRFFARLTLSIIALVHLSAIAYAGTLDDYYLQQFGQTENLQMQKALLSVSPEAQEPARCGMPVKHGLKRDWNLLELSTQKVLAKQLALPILSGSEQTLLSLSGRFRIHYTTTGTDAVPSQTWVQDVANTFDEVARSYTASQWVAAPTTGNNVPYDVYLRDLAPQGFFGATISGQPAPTALHPYAFTSWIELDNNFTDSIFKPATYSPSQSLQITAAHEYHHAIQCGYNFYFDVWYAEATSSWQEDELYDDVNQLYNYIPAWFTQSRLSLDIAAGISTGGGYGRWIFNRYLSEQHGSAMIRTAWENLASRPSPGNGADINMAPVLESVLSSTYGTSLGNDFFGFTKRVYTREWSTHTADISSIHPYSPVATYSAYPVNSSSQSPAVTLPHYSFAYYTFVPSATAPADLSLTLTGTNGIKATVFIKSNGGIIEYPFASLNNTTGTTITVPGFRTSSEAVLLIANTSDSDNHSAYFSTDGSTLPVYPPPQPAVPVSSGGGGSACFIATAAYGSYLHPQVRLLRDFRDEYLLGNAPGRAFVAWYYRCSPPLADFITRHPYMRSITRLALTPLVIAVAHPTGTVFSLLLLIGALLKLLQHRITITRLITFHRL